MSRTLKFAFLGIAFLISLSASAQKDDRQAQFDSLFDLKDSSLMMRYLNAEQAKNPKDWWPLYAKAFYLAVDSNILPCQQLLLKAIQLNPQCYKCYVQLGRNEMFWGNPDQSLIYIEKAVAIAPEEPYPTLYMGMYYEVVERSKALALIYYNKVLSQDAEYAYGYLTRGNYYFNSGNYFASKGDLEKAIAIDSQMAEAHYLLGQVNTYLNQPEIAAKHLSKAYSLDSNNASYRLGMAVSLTNTGRHEESLLLYDELVDANPEKPFYWCSRASVYYQLENMDAYCEDLRKADELSKDMPEFRKEFRIDMEMQKTCDKERSSYYFQRGVAAYNRQLYDTALQWYFRCAERYPKHCMNMSFIGNAYLAMNQYDSALAAYQQSYAWKESIYDETIETGKSPREAELYVVGQKLYLQLYMAECYLNLYQMDSAHYWMEEVRPYIGLPDLPIAGYFYSLEAQYFFQSGRYDLAIGQINKAIQQEPGSPTYLLKRVYYRLNKPSKTRILSFGLSMHNMYSPNRGSFEIPFDRVDSKFLLEECLRDCTKAIQLSPQYWMAYLMRAQLLMKMNRQSEACADFKLLEKAGFQFNVLAAPCAP